VSERVMEAGKAQWPETPANDGLSSSGGLQRDSARDWASQQQGESRSSGKEAGGDGASQLLQSQKQPPSQPAFLMSSSPAGATGPGQSEHHHDQPGSHSAGLFVLTPDTPEAMAAIAALQGAQARQEERVQRRHSHPARNPGRRSAHRTFQKLPPSPFAMPEVQATVGAGTWVWSYLLCTKQLDYHL
jgi:hypothetical protein